MNNQLPSNAGVFTFPKTDMGNDPADWASDQATVDEFQSRVEKAIKEKSDKPDPMAWMEAYTVSEAEAAEISDPEWIIENLVIRGHLILISAEPNGGKTTILFELSGQMADQGYNVVYVNGDIGGSDAKHLVPKATERGFVLALPDMKLLWSTKSGHLV